MSALTLVIGSKNSSSWSLRPWLAMTEAGIEFEEVLIPLRQAETAAAIARHSPTGKVPVLLVDGEPIAESLAICEYVAELAPDLWPSDRLARAVARSVSAEMHAGFANLRRHCPMDFVKRSQARDLEPEVAADVLRVQNLWRHCRERFGNGGDFLFGRFGVADAMYAPVVSRFVTYDVPRDRTAAAYIETVMDLPGIQRWGKAAGAEQQS